MTQTDHAATFKALHQGPEILVLPNAWDAASAALMAEAGAKAVATSSAAVAWSHGYPDGDALPVAALLATVREIARVLPVPLTVDIEGGYTDDLGELSDTVDRLIDAGVAGINLEDGRREPALHARKIEAVKQTAARRHFLLFLNARIDVYLLGLAEGEFAMKSTLSRAETYRSAGADGIFVPGPVDEPTIARLVQGIEAPLNVMGRPGAPKAAALQALGVRRLSSATGPFRYAYAALAQATATYLGEGDPGAYSVAAGALPDLNKRFAGG